MKLSTVLKALPVAGLLLLSPPTGAQEGGGDGGDDGGELTGELDYSSSDNTIFDEQAFHDAESTLQVGTAAQSKSYASYLYMGTVQLGGPSASGYGGAIPKHYVVQPGDTLLDIAARFFGNPDLWPEIWSLNPEITNPNWIYPGQLLMLIKESLETKLDPEQPKIIFQAKWKPGTVMFRNPGFIDEEIEEESGEIIGSFHETKYLSHLNSVYIKYAEGKAPGIGSTATVYRIASEVKDPNEKKKVYGKKVNILGTVKVTMVDEDHKLAKAIISESLEPIERGDLVGPMKWKLAVVAPLEASLDLEGKIIANHKNIENMGAGHVVFVDLGYEDGVVEGNTFHVVRKIDHYMASIGEDDGDPDFPWETIGKVIVLEALKNTSTCLMVESGWDVQVGDKVELRRGE